MIQNRKDEKHMRMDLHTHTNMSDGQHSPEKLVEMAAKAGISVLAITDHDTTDGIDEGQIAATVHGITFIPGIEISAKENRELHILGYYIDTENANLNDMNREFARLRKLRESRILDYLYERGIKLSGEQVKKHAHGGLLGRPHFAAAMIEKGYVSTIQEAFEKHLATPDFHKIERPKPSAEKCIETICGAGGVAVLAHPVTLKLDDEGMDEMIRYLVSIGLEGVEVYYPTHDGKQTATYKRLAEKYGLIMTGGSDFHGDRIKPNIKLGTGINDNLHFDDEQAISRLLERSKVKGKT